MCLFVISYNQKREKSTHNKSRLAKSEIPLEFGFQFSDGKKVREREYLEVVRTGMDRSERKRGNAGGGAGGSCGWKGVWVGERDGRKTLFLVFFLEPERLFLGK